MSTNEFDEQFTTTTTTNELDSFKIPYELCESNKKLKRASFNGQTSADLILVYFFIFCKYYFNY